MNQGRATESVAAGSTAEVVPRRIQSGIRVFLALFLLTGVLEVQAWPLTGWKLFSHLRAPESSRLTTAVVDRLGRSQPFGIVACLLGIGIVACLVGIWDGRRRQWSRAWRSAAPNLGERQAVVKAAIRRADMWLFQPGDARAIAAVRIGLCAILCGRLARGIYVVWAHQPPALYRPVSFMRLLPLPAPGVVVAVQAIGIVSCLLGMAGYKTRVSLPVAWACSTFLVGMVAGFGRPENEATLVLALVPLLAAPSGDAWSLDAWLSRRHGPDRPQRSVRYGWPVRSAMLVVAGGYLFVGLAKVVWSGPAWVTSGNLRWILYTASANHPPMPGLALFIADRPLLAHGMAAVALTSELLFPLVLWRSQLRWFFLPAVVLLHAAIWATIGLNYVSWAVTTTVVFVNWIWVVERFRRLMRPSESEYRSAGAVHSQDDDWAGFSSGKVHTPSH